MIPENRAIPTAEINTLVHGNRIVGATQVDLDAAKRRRKPRGQLMVPKDVAAAFHVDPRTVSRWGDEGRLSFTRTPGGHRRYYRAEVERVLRDNEVQAHE